MKKTLIVEGGTGSGKTHYCFTQAKNNKGKTLYLSPTNLLVYEAYQKYGTAESCLIGPEFQIGNFNDADFVFTNFATPKMKILKNINHFANVIIDEAQWHCEFEGHELTIKNILYNFKGNLFFPTATRNFKIDGAKIINLPSKFSFNIKEINIEDALERAKNGVKTMIICQTIQEGRDFFLDLENSIFISRENSELEIVRGLEAFKNNDANILIGTNILAQGLNIDCENLILSDIRGFSNEDLDKQKLGRLGRPFLGQENKTLTFAKIKKEWDEEDDESYSQYKCEPQEYYQLKGIDNFHEIERYLEYQERDGSRILKEEEKESLKKIINEGKKWN